MEDESDEEEQQEQTTEEENQIKSVLMVALSTGKVRLATHHSKVGHILEQFGFLVPDATYVEIWEGLASSDEAEWSAAVLKLIDYEDNRADEINYNDAVRQLELLMDENHLESTMRTVNAWPGWPGSEKELNWVGYVNAMIAKLGTKPPAKQQKRPKAPPPKTFDSSKSFGQKDKPDKQEEKTWTDQMGDREKARVEEQDKIARSAQLTEMTKIIEQSKTWTTHL